MVVEDRVRFGDLDVPKRITRSKTRLVIAVRPYPLWQLIKVWSKAQIQGATPNDRAIVKMSGRKIEVRSRSPKQISADGEPAGSIPVSFDVEHRALRVLVPDLKDATDSAK